MSRKTRRLIWSAPLVAVLAVAGALAIFVALEPGSVFANPLPAAPSELEVEAASGDAGRTTLVLDWTAPAGGNVSGYRIDMSNRGGVWETLVMDTASTATTYTDSALTAPDSALTASDTRWYRVFARNDHGIGAVSNAASGTTDERVNPGSVRNLRAVPNTKNPRTRLDLSWDAPAADGGEMIVGYEIQAHLEGQWRHIGSDADTTDVTVVTKTSYSDPTGMDPADTQLYRVRAVNGTEELDATAAGAGATASDDDDASKEWVQVTGKTQEAVAPGQVTGLTAVNTGTDPYNIDLYWYAPDNGGWRIDAYLIQAHREGKKFPSIPSDTMLKISGTAPTLGGPVTLSNNDPNPNVNNANWIMTAPEAEAVIANANAFQAQFDAIMAVDHDGDDADNNQVKDTTEAEDITNVTATLPEQVKWYFRVYALTTDDGVDEDAADTDDDVIRRSRSPSGMASVKPGTRLTLDHDKDEADDEISQGNKSPRLDPLAAPIITATSPPDAKKQQIDLGLTVNPGPVWRRSCSGADCVPHRLFEGQRPYLEDAGADHPVHRFQ